MTEARLAMSVREPESADHLVINWICGRCSCARCSLFLCCWHLPNV